jgi:Lipase
VPELESRDNWWRKKVNFVCGPTAYFHRGEYNIIIVDYGSLVKEPCLSQIGWGPRFCARCIAQLLYYLDQVSGTPPDSLHLIGYSVGAHIAGLVANYISFGKIGRITGTSRIFFEWTEVKANTIFKDENKLWRFIFYKHFCLVKSELYRKTICQFDNLRNLNQINAIKKMQLKK